MTYPAVLAGLAAALTALLTFLGAFNATIVPVAPAFGALGSPDIYTYVNLHANASIGGPVNASTTVATETLAATDINNFKLLNAKAAAASTLTLPTKAALNGVGFLPGAGDTTEWFIHASTSVITLAGSTGVSLVASASSSQVYAGRTAKITFVRLPAIEGATIEAKLSNDF